MKTQKLINIRMKLTEKANKRLEGYLFINGCENKAEAINKILEEIDLRGDIAEWIHKGDKDE